MIGCIVSIILILILSGFYQLLLFGEGVRTLQHDKIKNIQSIPPPKPKKEVSS